MNTFIKTFAVATTAVIALGGTINASAASTDALKGCKAEIAQDSRLAGYKLNARMDTMQTRGRYTNFTIDVHAKNADGVTSEWLATCKARSTGRVDSLELAQVTANGELVVAEN